MLTNLRIGSRVDRMAPAWLRINRASPRDGRHLARAPLPCRRPGRADGGSLPHPGARPAKAITRQSTLQEILEAYGTRHGLDVDKVIAAIKQADELA